MTETTSLRVTFIGNDGIGKISLQYALENGELPILLPIDFDYFTYPIKTEDGQKVDLKLFDTDEREENTRILEQLVFPDISLFVVCYSCSSPQSLQSVKERWVPRLRFHDESINKTPFIMLGLKADLQTEATTEAAAEMCEQLGGLVSIRCSAKDCCEYAARLGKGNISELIHIITAIVAKLVAEQEERKRRLYEEREKTFDCCIIL